MTVSVRDLLVKRGELKFIASTLGDCECNFVRDLISKRGTTKQKESLCCESNISISDVIVEHYLHNVCLPNETLDSVKEILKERGII